MNQRTALVTGANSGFGRLTAEAFAAAGWRVYATMRNTTSKNAQAAADLRKAGISVVELDVTSDASVDAAAVSILAEAGALDVLVNNAGTGHFGVTEAFTPSSVEAQLATNVIGPLRVNRAFLPSMRANKTWARHLRFVHRRTCCPSVQRRLHRIEVGSRSPGRSFVVRASTVRNRRRDRPTGRVSDRHLLEGLRSR